LIDNIETRNVRRLNYRLMAANGRIGPAPDSPE
jgi:hypothetical protein